MRLGWVSRKIFYRPQAALGVAVPILLLAFSGCAGAQSAPAGPPAASAAKASDPFNRESPQSSVFSFLEACHARNYERAWRYLDLRKVPPGQRKNGPQLAEQLGQILDRDAQFDVAALSRSPEGDRGDELPPNRDRVDSFHAGGQVLDVQMERVTLRSGLAVWLFSSESVALIPKLAQMTSESPIERYLPEPLVDWKLLDTPLWRWVALALLAAALAALSKLVAQVALLLTEPVVKRLSPRTNRSVLELLVGPFRLLFSAAVFRAGMEWIAPAARLHVYLRHGVTFLFLLGLAWLGARIVDLVLDHLRGVLEARHRTFSYSVLPLGSRVLKLIVLLLAIAAVLSDLGYNTTTILAGLGVGGLAAALAAQKTIENLFGGVAVISDRPVSIGDLCRFGDRLGVVEDIGLRSTRIRTPERTLVTVPNAEFSAMTLENLAKRDKLLFHPKLNLRRDTTPDQVRTVLESITKILTEHPKVQEGALPVRFIGVGDYSLDLEVFVYVLTRDNDEFLAIQQELLLRLLDAIADAGTALALPTQASVNYSIDEAPHENGRPSPPELVLHTQR